MPVTVKYAVAYPYLLPWLGDAEAFGRDMAEHDRGVAAGRRVEPAALGDLAAQYAEQVGRRRLDPDPARIVLVDLLGAAYGRVQVGGGAHLLDALDPADHPHRTLREMYLLSGEHRLAGRGHQEVGAQLVQFPQELGLAGGGDADHRDHRRDADGDAQRGEHDAHRAAAQARRADVEDVPGAGRPRRLRAAPGGRRAVVARFVSAVPRLTAPPPPPWTGRAGRTGRKWGCVCPPPSRRP